MGTALDRKQQRQRYLRKKAKAYSWSAIAAGACAFSIVAAIVYAGLFLVTVIHAVGTTRNPDPRPSYEVPVQACLGALAVIVLGFCGCAAIGWCKQKLKEASQLSYVAPVKQDTDLPIEEVLLRAADELPVARLDLLLRAATSSPEESGEELLRATGCEREKH